MRYSFIVCLICGFAACGRLVVVEPDVVDESVDEEVAEVVEATEEPADELPAEDDVAVGEAIATEDPVPVPEVEPEAEAVAEEPADPGPYVAGAELIMLVYGPLRVAPDSSADKAAVNTGGGSHSDGHPSGFIPPGASVVLLDAARDNGYYKVEYKGVQGFVHYKKLAPWDRAMDPIEFATSPEIRNAFFMHQIRRTKWNKDGPLSSGNCAPASLAMAAKIFGTNAPGKTIEQNIHEARNSYGASSNENDGTSRSEIVRGAGKLGLEVKELGTNKSIEAELDRLDAQLALRRAVVLEGRPGSAYRERMTNVFADQGVGRSYTFAGNHSILVVGIVGDGKYLVGDPISEVGMVVMNRGHIKSFISAWGGTGTAVWVER